MTLVDQIAQPTETWRIELGEYHIRCVVEEQPRGTFTVVVEENGRELSRGTIIGGGLAARDYAEQQGRNLDEHIRQKMREESLRLGLPADGTQRPCPSKSCGGILTFQTHTPVPGTGGVVARQDNTRPDQDRARRRAMIAPETTAGWSCSRCNHIEWMLK
jgi:hypothetical protein